MAAPDREAGEWVIRKGGRVMVNGGRQLTLGAGNKLDGTPN